MQHLSQDHKCVLSDVIERHTRMQVFEVADGMTVITDSQALATLRHQLPTAVGHKGQE